MTDMREFNRAEMTSEEGAVMTGMREVDRAEMERVGGGLAPFVIGGAIALAGIGVNIYLHRRPKPTECRPRR